VRAKTWTNYPQARESGYPKFIPAQEKTSGARAPYPVGHSLSGPPDDFAAPARARRRCEPVSCPPRSVANF
jgi:hypothetical protein